MNCPNCNHEIDLHEHDAELTAEARKPLVDALESAIDILALQDNAGKGRSLQELSSRNQQAIDLLRNALALAKVKQ